MATKRYIKNSEDHSWIKLRYIMSFDKTSFQEGSKKDTRSGSGVKKALIEHQNLWMTLSGSLIVWGIKSQLIRLKASSTI